MEILEVDSRQYHLEYGRATGRTFRRIMEAFKLASEGNHVFFIARDARDRTYVMYKILDLLSCYFGERLKNDRFKDKILFPGIGFVEIVTKEKWGRIIRQVGYNREHTTHMVIEIDDTD